MSTTVTIVEHDAVLVAWSDTSTPTILVPNGRLAAKETFVATGRSFAGKEFVCTNCPLMVQKTVRASPSGSLTLAVSSTGVPHSTVEAGGAPTTGGKLGGMLEEYLMVNA